MTHHERSFDENIGMSDHVSAEYTEPTNLRVLEALIGVLTNGSTQDIPNRYGTAVFLTAAFIESTANLLWDAVMDGQDLIAAERQLGLSGQDTNGDYLSKPIRKLLCLYEKACGQACPHSIDGLQDIFDVRNRIVAHPAGASREALDLRDDGTWDRQRIDRRVEFRKFTDWPTTYSQFLRSHANEAVAEAKRMLELIHDDLAQAGVDSEILKRAFPTALKDWSESA